MTDQPKENQPPDITVTLSIPAWLAERLAVLIEPQDGTSDLEAVILNLLDHVQQGVYRPGAWERSWLLRVTGNYWLDRVEPDPETPVFDRPVRPLPEWRTRAPEYTHEAYGLRVGSQDNVLPIIAAGHVNPWRMIAAACHYAREEWGQYQISSEVPDGWIAGVRYFYAAHDYGSTEDTPVLIIDTGPNYPGAFPVTILGETAPPAEEGGTDG